MLAKRLTIALSILVASQLVVPCPQQCKCSDRQPGKGLYAKCDGKGIRDLTMSPASLKNVSALNLRNNGITAIQNKAFGLQKSLKKLYLSRNKIRFLKNSAFTGLIRLNKLELSYNDLLTVTGEPFKGLKSLRFLDLSNNNLNFIDKTVFNGLRRLQKLILSNNKFIIIPEATLKPVPSLTTLKLDNNDLLCDCHIKWLLKIKKLRKGLSGTCGYPERMKLSKIKDVNVKELTCASLNLPYYDFNPNNDEVAIRGDRFTFTCGTTWIRVLKINWYKNNQQLIPVQSTNQSRVVIDFKVFVNTGRLVSTLTLKSLSFEDTGTYRCTVSSDETQINGKAMLTVLPGGSKYCHTNVTKTLKGKFKWDNTDLGVKARMRCPAGILPGYEKRYPGYAYRTCGFDGVWGKVNGSECSYVDRITQELFKLIKSPSNLTTAISTCKSLQRLIKNASVIQSDIDVSHVASILENLKPYMGKAQEVGRYVVRIVSKIMNVDQHTLAQSQIKWKACSKFVMILDDLVKANAVGTSIVADNVGLTIVPVYPATFKAGRTCHALLKQDANLGSLRCNEPWKDPLLFSPKNFEASIYIPKSIFGVQRKEIAEFKLKFVVYKNGKLFPHMLNGSLVTNPRVYTSVVNFQLGERGFENLTEPIAIKYRNHESSDKFPPVAVKWDFTKKGGKGSWLLNNDCTITKTHNTSTSFCKKLTNNNYLALLMFVEKSPHLLPVSQYNSMPLRLVVYIGAGLCSLLVLLTFITYAVFRKLRYNRDDAAMLMNLCLALLVSIILFPVGIYRVNNTLMCRAIGVLLHYFVLCALLWVGCGALCLCRMLRTAVFPEEFNPVMRYYMISWGIPLIICGITVAGNPDNYNIDDFCYLRKNPFLGGFVGPACLVILIDIILYIRLNNMINSTYAIMNSDENEEAGDDDEHLSEHFQSKTELLHHMRKVLPEKADVCLYQKGSVLVLVLIIINFTFAFLLVMFNKSRSLLLVFSVCYCLSNVALGTVVFVFHCLMKSSAKTFWSECFRSFIYKKNNYLVDQEVVPNTDSTPDKPMRNGEIPGENTSNLSVPPRIYGSQTGRAGSDIQSNVSVQSSTVFANNPLANENINNLTNTPQHVKPCSPQSSDKHSITTSDKQSCVSAPLPFSHSVQANENQPPRYSYCCAEASSKKKKKKTRPRAPLALPDRNGISSSRESGIKKSTRQKTPELPGAISETDVTENAPSELSSMKEPTSYLETPVPYSSCASSDVSVPVPVTLTSRPPIPGASEPPASVPHKPYPYVNNTGKGPAFRLHHSALVGGNQPRTKAQLNVNGQEPFAHANGATNYRNHCPMFVPQNVEFPRNISYPTYPNTIPEERYVSMPKRSNGRSGQSESDHVYESIDEQQKADDRLLSNQQLERTEQYLPENIRTQNNEITDSENTSLIGHQQSLPTASDQNRPARRSKPRNRSDKSRTRRNRDSGMGRRKENSLPGYSSTTSLKSGRSERIKPAPKEWVNDTIPRMAYVAIPHLIERKDARNETSV